MAYQRIELPREQIEAQEAVARLASHGQEASVIGEVTDSGKVVIKQ